MKWLLFLASFLAVSGQTQAQSCLDQVATFAERICGEIQKSGFNQIVEANGQLKAEVSGIVSRVIGNGSGNLNGKVLRESYENVLRQDLGKELFSVRDCRVKMVEVGRAEACKPATKKSVACDVPEDYGTIFVVDWDDADRSYLVIDGTIRVPGKHPDFPRTNEAKEILQHDDSKIAWCNLKDGKRTSCSTINRVNSKVYIGLPNQSPVATGDCRPASDPPKRKF